MSLILASGSRIRSEILNQAGIPFQARPPRGEEPHPEPGESPAGYTLRAARFKAGLVSRSYPEHFVLGSDQVVAFEGEILRKVGGQNPLDAACERLKTLSGRTHELIGSMAIYYQGEEIHSSHSRVGVHFFDLTAEEIRSYLEEEQPYSSVGCYFLEGKGIGLVKELDGSWFAALGLDLMELQRFLRQRPFPAIAAE
jgi:septum formation protein